MLEHAGDRDPGGGRLLDYELASDGEHATIMDISDEGWVHTSIAQRELCELAARSILDVANRVLARNRLTLNDVAWIVPAATKCSSATGIDADDTLPMSA